MSFKGEVKYIATISQVDGNKFHENLIEQIEKCGNLYAEVHYQTTAQPDGKVVHSAVVLGRHRND